MTSPRSRVRGLTPLLVVSDFPRALDFYQRALGFVEPSVWGEPPCFAMLNRDGFELMLSLAEKEGDVRPNGPTGRWDCYLRVDDVAAEIAALAAAGVPLASGPTDTFYQMREVEVLDPDGHRVCLAEDVSVVATADSAIYEGVLDLGSAKLRLVLKLVPKDGRLAGLLDSPDQGASNLALDAVERAGARLCFTMKAIGASYEGTFGADDRELQGTWTQRGRSWPLAFRKM